jgi:hypothetical protein
MLSSVLLLASLCYAANPPLVRFDECPWDESESLFFSPAVPCIAHTDFTILCGVLRRNVIVNNKNHTNSRLLLYLSLILITQANDINLNPGPASPTENDRDYLCGTCDTVVDWGDRGVMCETCDQWYHASCQNIHTLSYNQLEDPDLNISWHCIICNNPNYSATVHDCQTVDVSIDITGNSTLPSLPPQSPESRQVLRPIHSSTPTRKKGSVRTYIPLKVININFQSIKSKSCRLNNVIYSVKPDVIIGTETLDADIKDAEICHTGYKLHRKDRLGSGGGGVLIAVKTEYNSETPLTSSTSSASESSRESLRVPMPISTY